MNRENPNPSKSDQVSNKGVRKIRTTIEGFDEITHGGLPIGRTTLVSGTSGTGKTLLAVQFLYHGIKYFDKLAAAARQPTSKAVVVRSLKWTPSTKTSVVTTKSWSG